MKRIRLEIGEWYFADEVDKRISELEAQLAEAQKDAERYQLLKELIEWKPAGYDGLSLNRFDLYWPQQDEVDLDAALDAAMETLDDAKDHIVEQRQRIAELEAEVSKNV